MKNTLIIILAVILILIAGCTPAGTGPQAAQALDPNLESVRGQMTVDAKEAEIQIFNAMSTGTAYAPIMAITQQAADLIVQQTQQSMQSTQIAASWTQTPSPVPTITPSPTPNVTMTALIGLSIAEMTQTTLDLQNQEYNNKFFGALPALLFAIAVSALGYLAITYSRERRRQPVQRDEHGKTVPILDNVTGEYVDLSASPNYAHKPMSTAEELMIDWIGKRFGLEPVQPRITVSRMDATKEREQMIEMQRLRIPKRLRDSMMNVPLLTADSDQAELSAPRNFLLPEWDIINGWDSKDGLPYYTAKGLETFRVEKVPHISVIGETGAGKTRKFLRPMIACALAAGYRVVIIGKAKDYQPFENHPNATLIRISNVLDPEQALRYANILGAVVQEMNRRDEVLSSRNVSTWSQAGYPGTIIVCDEISNSLNIMDNSNRSAANQARAWAGGLVAEGRAVGLHMWFGSQRATKMLNIYSQTRKAIFRVAPEEEAQHRSMAGASQLDTGYYIAKFGSSQIAGGFEPTDAELLKFMQSRPVQQLESDQWIDAIATDAPKSLPTNTSRHLIDNGVKAAPIQSKAEFVNGLSEWETRVLDLYEARVDKTNILESVFTPAEYQIGRVAIDELIQRWQAVKGVASATSQPASAPAEIDTIAARESDIIHRYFVLHQSKAQIQREVFGDQNTGGINFQKIKTVIEQHESATTKSTTTDENAPVSSNFDGVAA